jgi:hypothetical protein
MEQIIEALKFEQIIATLVGAVANDKVVTRREFGH